MHMPELNNIIDDFELPYVIENDHGQLSYAIKNRLIGLIILILISTLIKTFWVVPLVFLLILNLFTRFNIVYPFYNNPTIKFFIYFFNNVFARPLFG
jgi:predicted membrane protein